MAPALNLAIFFPSSVVHCCRFVVACFFVLAFANTALNRSSDVLETNFSDVISSSISEKLRKIKRYDDDEIENEFGKENIKYFTAPQGSAFIVDTYGFHKGLLPSKGNRLLLQIQYSLSPIGIENYEPIEVKAHPYNKYINRLLIK